MEAAKADSKAVQQPEKKKVVRKPGNVLWKTKKALDGLLKDLTAYPEILDDAKKLREKVFNKFIEEEKALPV